MDLLKLPIVFCALGTVIVDLAVLVDVEFHTMWVHRIKTQLRRIFPGSQTNRPRYWQITWSPRE